MALGIIEVYGFSTAIMISDSMAKSAEISILSIDKNKPVGDVNIPLIMIINIVGNISAVNHALSIGIELSKKINAYVISHIISNEEASTIFLASKNAIGNSKLNKN